MGYNTYMVDVSFIRDGERVLAAVSGGADSVAMLRLLQKEAEKGRIELFAAHFEHGIRGEDSERDAAFTEALCARFGIPFFLGRGDVPTLAREQGMGLEEAARQARYAFLYRIRQQVGADCIALAHHMDDQAETVLMHILRGASLRGARGMEVRRNGLFRPLLHVPKAEIVAWLHEIGQPYCEDLTNRENDNPRNLLRNRAMPILEAAYPGARQSLVRFAQAAARDDMYLQSLADAAKRIRMPGGWIFHLEGLAEAVASRVIASETEADGAAMERILSLPEGGSTQCRRLRFERRGGFWFALEQTPDFGEAPLQMEGKTELSGVCCMEACSTRGEAIKDDPWRQRLDKAAMAGCVLRTRRAGDRMVPLGMAGSRLLSDIFTDRKLPRPLRDRWPVAAKGNEILWIPGVGISEKAKIGTGERTEIICRPEAWLSEWLKIRKDEEHAYGCRVYPAGSEDD